MQRQATGSVLWVLSIMLRIYFFAAVIQSIRPWRGGGVVRVFRTAAVYGRGPWPRGSFGQDDDLPIPPSSGKA